VLSELLGVHGYEERVAGLARSNLIQQVSALSDILSPDHIHGTELDFDPRSGEVRAIKRVPAGYGKVAVIEELGKQLSLAADRVQIGDGRASAPIT